MQWKSLVKKINSLQCTTNLKYHTLKNICEPKHIQTLESDSQNRRISFTQINIHDVYQYTCINKKRIYYS